MSIIPTCGVQGCEKSCYQDSKGVYSVACGINHYNMLTPDIPVCEVKHCRRKCYLGRNGVYSRACNDRCLKELYPLAPECAFPGCTRPFWCNPSTGGYSNACGETHRVALRKLVLK